MNGRARVAIVGAGFGGLAAAKALDGAPVDLTVVDQNNFHTFQPLLYQVATAGLDADDVAHSVRGVVRREGGTTTRLATVQEVDLVGRRLVVDHGPPVEYDFLVLAAGAVTDDYGVPGVREHAFGMKSLQDAIRLRNHVLAQFEAADADPAGPADGALTVVVVGGGATGVELAGSLSELFRMVLAKDFPDLDHDQARVVLLEATDRLLGAFHPRLQGYAARRLADLGVEVRMGASVEQVRPDAVCLHGGGVIPTRTVAWAAGVRATRLPVLGEVERGRGGRIVVRPDLSLPDHPEVFVIGDLAASPDGKGGALPQLAPVAQQGGRHAARQIERRLRGEASTPFRYVDKGTMATIGRHAAVAELPFGLRFSGGPAWLAWLFLHLLLLVGFRNRLNVLINWAWNYVTYDRGARLILDHNELEAHTGR
ncbi:MAG TPA: NAD(P)/FAD-dependent oxidoreductase [Acidimicrobiales bacterium]|nr:NAD(P)/FAD-dependent oxidoreductase [Acidimicrobiales bacterium]